MKAFNRSKLLGTVSAASLAVSLLLSPACQAAEPFNHVVRIIVPDAPGGTSDILARILAPKLQSAIGQTVIVENKPGAAGNLGADAVAKSPKDGHTLLLTDIGTLATAPSLFKQPELRCRKGSGTGRHGDVRPLCDGGTSNGSCQDGRRDDCLQPGEPRKTGRRQLGRRRHQPYYGAGDRETVEAGLEKRALQGRCSGLTGRGFR